MRVFFLKRCFHNQNGDGLVDTPEKKQAIVDGIKEALEKSAANAALRKSSLAGSTEVSRKSSLSGSIDMTTRKSSMSGLSSPVEGVLTPIRRMSLTSARNLAKLRVHIIYW